MAPIKIGFIGLSSSQSWATWAHLPYLQNSTKYQIVALCNSSKESAEAAIKIHSLASTTKAYGSPAELAADPDVELVVCSVRVDKHYEAMMPALKAGKDVFCEWPLAKDTKEAEEMLALAKKTGAKTLVGLQAGVSPALKKIRQVLESGRIGKVLSTNFHGTPKFFGATEFEGLAWENDISIGGNMLSIYTVHSLEGIQKVLSPLATFTPLLAISHPEVQITTYTGEPTTRMTRTSHDQILLQGKLQCGALFSYHLRGGPAFDNTIGAVWRIYGSKGEVQVTGPDSYLQISDDNVKIEVFEHASGKTEVMDVDKDAFSGDVLYSRNIARLYEAFADGKGEDEGVLGWDTALKRHKFIDEVYAKAGVN